MAVEYIKKPEAPSRAEQVSMMADDACYDVADYRGSDSACIPDYSAVASIKAAAAPPKVPKVFLANDCSFNCAYCGCRASNERRRKYCLKPPELAAIAVDEAVKQKRGIFLSSAVYKNADYTQELIVETLRIIRRELRYSGYLHAKVMPGADAELIRRTGQYANRMSVNIEVARGDGYQMVAKQKNRDNILTPMRQISSMIREARDCAGRQGACRHPAPRFATSQTTQLMAGSVGETDRTIMSLSQALYSKYRLSRVYYTAFTYLYPVRGYDLPPYQTPHWRMSRLYQADRLMKLYGFSADDVAPESCPNLSQDVDPKAEWALRHLDMFPVEINRADYDTLLRVPGIGIIFAKRIIEARRGAPVTHEVLGKVGVSLKRCQYFITCGGKFNGAVGPDEADALRAILSSGGVGSPSGGVGSRRGGGGGGFDGQVSFL